MATQTDRRPSLLLTRRWPDAGVARLSELFDVTVDPQDRPLSEDALCRAMQEHDVLCPTLTDRITARVIGTADRRVKLIASYGAGFDHIDLDACRAAGLPVTNTPGVLTEATAEIAIMLMLMVARRAVEGEREARTGNWTGWRPTHLCGTGVTGGTMGLVGFGRIAQAVAAIARSGFGMNILYHSRRRAAPDIEARTGATFVERLDDMLARADVVSLHVPGGPATRNLIDTGRLAAMKADAILVNTARGDVVDHAALAVALRAGRIAGAGLDVYPQEPAIPDELRALPNVVLLPHLGSATRATREAMVLRVRDNIVAFMEGRPLPDRVG